MGKVIVCITGRCSSWGKSWKKHLYNGAEDCLRCGMNRKEQRQEDRYLAKLAPQKKKGSE